VKKVASQDIYQIKVTLLGITPPIWRRLLVPASLTLEHLHHVLQFAMGWSNCHLHDFRIGGQRFAEPDADDPIAGPGATTDEASVRLSRVLGNAGTTAVYTYDFGDGWEHEIVVEKILAPEAGRVYPMCVGGKRHCPPEDCCGVPGYTDLLKAIADPEHNQDNLLLMWLGGRFDPEEFSVDAVNRLLAPSLRRRRVTEPRP
jgi:hypothetical protein